MSTAHRRRRPAGPAPVNVDRATRRTWAEVDLDAVAANVRAVRDRLSPGTRFMAVVKADAYGHGAVPVARAAVAAGAAWLGVATVDEGLELRRARITVPVLVMGAAAPAEVRDAVRADLSLTITSSGAAALLAKAGRRARLHLKIDTGMTRLGVAPAEVPAVLATIAKARVPLEGVYTHLATADDPDDTVVREQLSRFDAALGGVRQRFPAAIVHAGNSAAALVYRRSHYDMVRVGLAMYGLYSSDHVRRVVTLTPAMRLMSRVVRTVRVEPGTAVSYGATYHTLRPTTIATIACGYADGYPRPAGLNGEVTVGGRRLQIAGRVCMDYLMVDAGDHPIEAGDPAELFGLGVSTNEVAAWAHTISYEIVCGVGPRVPRVYLRGGRAVVVSQR